MGTVANVGEELKGHTTNDSSTFYFIAGINAFVLTVVMVASSGGFAAAPEGAVGTHEKGIFAMWFQDASTKFAAGERPFQESTSPEKTLSDKEKAKVLDALKSITKVKDDANVMQNLFDAIAEMSDLEDFKAALNDTALFE